ncbi:hypothetical protein EBV26_07010 [bacterium]|nr:hypothetical protein [bacterium]
MTTNIVNGDTSLILINTRDLAANDTAVVLLSSINYPGRTVTIRDSVGYLSSPQSIIVSTQSGVTFADGTSSITMNQPFSYLTVTSRDASSWSLKNSFAFPQNKTIANAASFTTSSIVTSNVYSYMFVSTPYINTETFAARSSLAVYGPTYISTLLVGTPFTTLQADPGYSLYVQGAFKNTGNMNVEGDVYVRGNMSTGSNLYVLGNISSLGSFGVGGDIMTVGNILAPNGSVITNNIDVRGTTSIGGAATFSNSVVIASNVSVGNAVTASNFTTSSMSVASSIQFQEKYIAYRAYDLLFSDAITLPGVSTQNITASNGITTNQLTVYNTIDATYVSSFLLSSAAITNPNGTLTISSILANSASFSNTVSTSQFLTSSLVASTLFLAGNIYASPGGYIETDTLVASTLSTGVMYADSLYTTYFTTQDLSITSLTVETSLIADNVSTFSAVNAFVDNTGGTLSTGSIRVSTLIATSSITNTSGQYLTNSGSITFTASNVYMNNLGVSTLTASSITTSSLTTTQLTMGAVPSANAPYFTADLTYGPSNVLVTDGPGDFLTPFFLSNVKPPGISMGDPYIVEASFALNFPASRLPGYYATILGFNLYPNGELNSQISIRTINDSNTITTLYGLYGTNQSYSTPPNTGGIPVPVGPLPSSFIHVVGTMYGDSAFSLQFQSRSNDNYVGIDSNTSITIQNGAIRWPYSLNGTTIQNSLNDMSVRSLYYYGALNFASDPALKEHIHDANLERCSEVIEGIPLRRFKYIDPYLSTFQQKDMYRLGFLATELESVFPKSITYRHMTDIPGYDSTFRMIDTQQIDMAHIGATKALMQRVSSLYVTLEQLRRDIST